MRWAVIGLSALALVGCKSTQQIAAEDNQTCVEMGAKPGSDAYVACRLQMRQEAIARRQRIADALDGAAEGIRRAQPIRCTSTSIGSTTNTECQR